MVIDGQKMIRMRAARPFKQILEDNVRMADGTLVTEVKYTKWAIDATYDYMPDHMLKGLLESLEKPSFLVEFTPPNTNDRVSATFKCVDYPTPSIVAWNRNADPVLPMWSDISFKLEEI